jgi:8-amino-7-oxononanoate synthase
VSWNDWAESQGDDVRSRGQWRAPRQFDAAGPVGDLVSAQDPTRRVISFASNDYLGLTQHPSVIDAAHRALDRWGAGSGSARLVVGSRPVHHELETSLAEWKASDAAVLFPTGYAANLGVLDTIAGPGTTVLSDELNHASIIDGCRICGGTVRVYRHLDLDHLASLLDGSPRPIVVSDVVFSMDGDEADVEGLADLCRAAGALLVLDEAHAVLARDPGRWLSGVDVIRVGTLSKTLGSLGGFAATSRPLADLLVNRARSYIFTTASTPADSAAALAALDVVRSDEGASLLARLRAHVDLLQPGHPSPIIPYVVGEEAEAVQASSALLASGYLVPAIRPPTVARGTSRLRVALSAAHAGDDVAGLGAAIDELGLDGPHGR